ncbi:MAG: insulinase family protein [candidate division Zixibacteria bacterium]|nr:insulinase family protein [candidate division Zixibacteria bacterium]
MSTKNLIKYSKTVLKDGLRIISENIPSSRSISIGVWIDIGSRNEHRSENGISHFIEHMLFKGTKNRSAKKIAASLESIGGNINAFTSREQTCYLAVILDEHLEQAVDVLSDILMNSTLTSKNIEREKSVVTEEIHEVRENPSDLVHEHFSENFWQNQPLGRSILGTEENVLSFSRKAIKKYILRSYLSGRVVIAAAGNVSHQKLVGLVKKKFNFPEGIGNRGESAVSPTSFTQNVYTNKSAQNHLCLGFPGIQFNNPDRYNLLALYTYLGSGMSSVLFQKIREEKGMAYSIYAFADYFRDNGMMGIYFGTDKQHLPDALETTLKELRKMKKTRLPKSKLINIKAQIKGHLTLALESTNGRMARMGRQELLGNEYIPLDKALKDIDRITSNNILEIARKIFVSDGMTITSLGPGTKEDLDKVDYSI